MPRILLIFSNILYIFVHKEKYAQTRLSAPAFQMA